jgi:hypothetical protein
MWCPRTPAKNTVSAWDQGTRRVDVVILTAIYRALAAADPDAFQPGLAIALGCLGAPLNALEHYKPALAATREVVALYLGPAARIPARSNPCSR